MMVPAVFICACVLKISLTLWQDVDVSIFVKVRIECYFYVFKSLNVVISLVRLTTRSHCWHFRVLGKLWSCFLLMLLLRRGAACPDQWEGSIQVTWPVLTNEKAVLRWPMRGQGCLVSWPCVLGHQCEQHISRGVSHITHHGKWSNVLMVES